MPKLKGRPKKMAMAATVGIVSPILANADPNARLRLLCRRFALAPLIAAYASGINTNIAMAMPTTVFGAPAAFTVASIAGFSASASPTTIISEASSRMALMPVLMLLGLSA